MSEPRSPYDQQCEAIARVLAAVKLGLVGDPTGAYLPDDLWRQSLSSARACLWLFRDEVPGG